MAARNRPRRRRLSRVLVSLATVLLVIFGIAGAAAVYVRTVFEAPGPLKEARTFTVDRGMRTPDIAAALERSGIIADDNVFLVIAYLTGRYRQMKAGEYQFEKNASMESVMDLIVTGRELVYKLTVPEGWTTAQVVERVAAHRNLTGEISGIPAEGTILPETYLFRRGMTRDGLLQQMREAQAKLFDELWAKRAPGLPFTTKEEALILASIVEKETAVPEERPRIAAVFINRLRAGMRLQSDPTIIYGITRGRSKLDRPILKSDIEETTPYNTYRIAGLPPTPIANPGKESIAAVLNPIATRDLYFVADGSGGHVFAETLEEHRKNVRKWRAVERSLAEAEAEAEAETAAPSPAAASLTAEVPPADEPPAQDQAAPAEGADFEPPAPAGNQAAGAAPPEPAPAPPEPAPAPRRLVEVSGKLVPIPTPRPRRN